MSLAVAVLTACGGGSDNDSTDTAPPVGAESPAPSPAPAPAPRPAPPPPGPAPGPAPSPAPAPPSPAPSPSPAPAPAPAPVPSPPPAVGSATLQWSASSDSRITGYRVYWGTASRTYQQALGAGTRASAGTSHVVSNLPSGRTYYFAVTAYDGNGTESAFSSEATKTIP